MITKFCIIIMNILSLKKPNYTVYTYIYIYLKSFVNSRREDKTRTITQFDCRCYKNSLEMFGMTRSLGYTYNLQNKISIVMCNLTHNLQLVEGQSVFGRSRRKSARTIKNQKKNPIKNAIV